MTSKVWNEEELNGITSMYLSIYRAVVVRGDKINKAELLRAVRGEAIKLDPHYHQALKEVVNLGAPLANRSKGSVEAKLMNMSAAVVDMGIPELSLNDHGYKASHNYQKALITAMAQALAAEVLVTGITTIQPSESNAVDAQRVRASYSQS